MRMCAYVRRSAHARLVVVVVAAARPRLLAPRHVEEEHGTQPAHALRRRDLRAPRTSTPSNQAETTAERLSSVLFQAQSWVLRDMHLTFAPFMNAVCPVVCPLKRCER